MQNAITLIKDIFKNRELLKKFGFTLGILLFFRFLAHIPVPGVNIDQLQALFSGNQFLSLLNIFSGGTLANFSIVAVGINPYITASIVIQLATMIFPALKEIQKDGEAGRERINQYTRLLAVPLAVVQSITVITLMQSQGLLQVSDPLSLISLIMTLVAGAMVLMWLGELVTTYGIGNGISMVLLAGIASQIPVFVAQSLTVFSTQQWLPFIITSLVFLIVISVVVFMNEGVRKVSISYAKRVRGSRVYGGQTTHLPIRVNVTGVLPIIFAVSVMLAPSFLARLLITSGNLDLVNIGQTLMLWFAPTSPVYIVTYFLVVFFFTFLSALIFFNASDISDELKKSGAFILGIRPGAPTKKYLEFVVTRITLVGALFLGGIAILPSIAQNITGIASLAIGGTSVLIVVSVILETAKQVRSQLLGQNYDQFT